MIVKQLAQFVQAQEQQDETRPSTTSTALDGSSLRLLLDEVAVYYDQRGEEGGQLLSNESVDYIVLRSLYRLLLLQDTRMSGTKTQENIFTLFLRVLRTCRKPYKSIGVLVAMLQACVLYLPVPANVASDGKTSMQAIASHPEEVRLVILECIQVLLSTFSAMPVSQPLASSPQEVHFFAYMVACLLQIAEVDRCRPASQLAVTLLTTLIQCISDPLIVRQFFPGIALSMWKCIDAPRQSSTLIITALHCFSELLLLCLSDHDERDQNAYNIEALRSERSKGTDITSSQSRLWHKETVQNVDLLLKQILSAKIEQTSWKVRHEIVMLCRTVVLDCRHRVEAPTFIRCFEELLVLRVHAIADVVNAAQAVLTQLQTELPTNEWLMFDGQFSDRFSTHLSTLSMKCATGSEAECIHIMYIMIGYLDFLGPSRFQTVLDADLSSTLHALVHVVAVNSIDVDVLQHETLYFYQHRLKRSLVISRFPIRFRHFQDESTIRVVLQLLNCVGRVVTTALLVDTAFSLIQEEGATQTVAPELFVIINEALRAHVVMDGSCDLQFHLHLVGRILDEVLSLPEWTSTTLSTKRVTTTVSLMIECIGICVRLVQNHFSDLLLHTLYPVVEKLGSPSAEIERAALVTLQTMALFCAQPVASDQGCTVNSTLALQSLFEANMDYVVHALCMRLEVLDMYADTPRVVEGLLRHTSIVSLPLVEEITRSLLCCVDTNQEIEDMGFLLRSLHLLVTSFATSNILNQHAPSNVEQGYKWSTLQEEPSSQLSLFLKEVNTWTVASISEVESEESLRASEPRGADADQDLIKMVKGAMPIEYDENSDHGNGVVETEDEYVPPLPFEAHVVQILHRCTYFLSDPDPVTCCLVLSTIENGLVYLRDRQKTLLPLIHVLWPSVVHRLEVTNRPILAGTMRLIAVIAQIAGDFIGDRFIESVWPTLKTILNEINWQEAPYRPRITRAMLQLTLSNKRSEIEEDNAQLAAQSSRTTQEMRLLDAILSCLIAASQYSATITSLVPDILVQCRRFLSSALPAVIVERTQTLFQVLAERNGDEVFVSMAMLSDWHPPSPPSARFCTFSKEAIDSTSNDSHLLYQANAAVVMRHISPMG